MTLAAADFAAFFAAIHAQTPFPWQQALVETLAETDTWPDVLDLPSGAGKTAALDAAVFHMALRAGEPARAPRRIALAVDRRIVDDDAEVRARRIAQALGKPATPITAEVARRLATMAGPGAAPLATARLRGGTPLEREWARSPTQPTIMCSTVDQIGSRLLFRGYGVSERMRPVHAGLLGAQTLIMLREAHSAEPFRQTLQAIQRSGHADVTVTLLAAAPGLAGERPLRLSDADRHHPVLAPRLQARKPARLARTVRGDTEALAGAFVGEAERAIETATEIRGTGGFAVGVIVNRVAVARGVHAALVQREADVDAVLLAGQSRPIEHDAVTRRLAPFKTGAAARGGARPLVIVATQCLEVGTDLDLDALVTQAAPLEALRQRFGRLNRAGRPGNAPATIIAHGRDLARGADDPIYGDRIRTTWEWLRTAARKGTVDFSPEAMERALTETKTRPEALCSRRADAPVIMPAEIALLSCTAPAPAPDPDVSRYLHGTGHRRAAVAIAWRNDLNAEELASDTEPRIAERLTLLPVRSTETLQVPIAAARRWLAGPRASADIADSRRGDDATARARKKRTAWRWHGPDDPRTGRVTAARLRPGDLIVVPSSYGGCDAFGWNPDSTVPVRDVADGAAKADHAYRVAIRTPAKGEESADLDTLLATTRGAARRAFEQLRAAGARCTIHYPYPDGRPTRAILVAELAERRRGVATTEHESTDGRGSSMVTLDAHSRDVERIARSFAAGTGLDSALIADIALAAYLHDAGKADPRFQTLLAGGAWNRPDDGPLAKATSAWSPRRKRRTELPPGWRHEALSVRMARVHPRWGEAHDTGLVLWLIGSHHGRGRPYFEFADGAPQIPAACLDTATWTLERTGAGPESGAFDLDGLDWPGVFDTLQARYGTWKLAHMEAIVRLADHRASEHPR